MDNYPQTQDRLLRLEQIIPGLIPISKTSWWNGVKAGIFPQGLKLGPRTRVWRESEIMKLIQNGVTAGKETDND